MNLSLNQPLPADLVVGMTWGPFRYRKYPVFSVPWLKGRFWSTGIAVVLYGLLSFIAHMAVKTPTANNLASIGYFIAGFLIMFNGGPLLASWVRHRGIKREGLAIVVAIILGFIIAMFSDAWASGNIGTQIAEEPVPAAERRISQLEEATLRLANLGALFIYFGCGGGLACLGYFSERRRWWARHALQSDMQLSVLQAQIEPHFLFNTLAAIRPLIREDSAQAEKVLDALADHLRATLPKMREDGASTLGQQLEICGSYLAVMQARMGDRLQFEMQAPEELHSIDFPQLMLLSLVENAIKHGMEPKPGPSTLIIRAQRHGRELRVAVLDDGLGLRDGLQSGVGLANIREQLLLRYQSRARLTVASRPEGGTMAEITLPLPA
jgi:sensor histidine kinase YesM